MPQEAKIVEDVLRPFEDLGNKSIKAREIVAVLNLIIPLQNDTDYLFVLIIDDSLLHH